MRHSFEGEISHESISPRFVTRIVDSSAAIGDDSIVINGITINRVTAKFRRSRRNYSDKNGFAELRDTGRRLAPVDSTIRFAEGREILTDRDAGRGEFVARGCRIIRRRERKS